MKFNRNHKVIVSSLTKEEAVLFLGFLQRERVRHSKCVDEANFMWGMQSVIGQIWDSAALRHEEDIKKIDAEIKKVKGLL